MVETLLHPRSVAVVGVSVEPLKVGHQVFANLLSYRKPVFPINPKHKKILGKTCYPTLLSIPGPVDLVVIATPANTVEDVIHQCVDKKVRAVILITAGFAEASANGAKLQQRIKDLCDHHGITLLGPNTLGAVLPATHFNASFASAAVGAGHIGLISQSGAMLTTIFSTLQSRGSGCSFALSLGNGAGIGINDALKYAMNDPATHLIALYVESIPSLAEFFFLSKTISATKPILILKGGVSEQGQHASLSHTAALATDVTLLRAAQEQYGFTIVETIEQFFETMFFLEQLLQKKNGGGVPALPKNLLILTNAGGPGVNAVDLASRDGIALAIWQRKSIDALSRAVPFIRAENPTDLLGDASVETIATALEIALEDGLIESILLIITPQAVTDIVGIVAVLVAMKKQHKLHKPIIVALMGGEQLHSSILTLRKAGFCVVEYANEGVEIIAHVERVRRAMLVDRSKQVMRQMEEALLSGALTDKKDLARRQFPVHSTTLEEAYLLLEDYEIPYPRSAIIHERDHLEELKTMDPTAVFPLIAKTANLKLKHKAVVGGVIPGIQSIDAAYSAYDALHGFGGGVLFQEHVSDAVEVILGGRRDTAYGLFLAVGHGGSLTNIVRDRAYAFLPASIKELRATLLRTQISTLLTKEQFSIVQMIMGKLALLLREHPEIVEIEINPLLVTDHNAVAADIKLELQDLKTQR